MADDDLLTNVGRVDDNVNTALLTPEECVQMRLWEIDPLYYTPTRANGDRNSSRPLRRGKAYRCLKTGEYKCFEGHDGVVYNIGDNVYLEMPYSSELPYFICGIQGFKMTKREQLSIKVSWYYRHTEVPETVYHSLVQERHTEHSNQDADSELQYIIDPKIRCRELFISDAADYYNVSTLRGKCGVRHYKDVAALRDFPGDCPDTFFYILGYNPENNRLASILGEIRVGSAHQAKLPEFRPDLAEYPLSDDERAGCPPRELLVWAPERLRDSDLHMFLRAARSMAAFAGICDGTTEDGIAVAAKDDTTIDAYKALHGSNYDTGKALHELVERRKERLSAERAFTEEETKKFCKGLKQWSKNFFRIRKELLPHRTTGELIEFYYLWKKTPQGLSQRPRQPRRRPQQATILRRIKTGPNNAKPSRPASSEFLDFSSASENEIEESEAVVDLSGYACHHCYSTASKDWHHAGRERALLCTDCRLYFKKYGELRAVARPNTPPPYLFRSMATEPEFCDDYGVRTRAGKASANRSSKTPWLQDALLRRRTMTPTAEMESSRKSPSAASTSSTSSSNSNSGEPATDRKPTRKTSTAANRRKRSTRKSAAVDDDKDARGRAKRKRTSTDSPTKSDESDDAVSDNTPGSPKTNAQRSAAAADLKSPQRVSPRKASSVYDFREEGVVGDDGATGKREVSARASSSNGADSMDVPKAATSVIQVNLNSVKAEDGVEEDKENVSDPGDVPPKEADPKIDDTICYESSKDDGQATFKRHWNRGENNSCARTDLEFRVKPGCNWARRCEERKKRPNGHAQTTVIKQEPNALRHEGHAASVPQVSPVVSRPATIMSSAQMAGLPSHLGSPHMPPGHMLHPFLGNAMNGFPPTSMPSGFPASLTAGARLQQYAEQVQAGVLHQAQQAFSMGDMTTYHRLMMIQQEQQRMEQIQRERDMIVMQQQHQLQQQEQQRKLEHQIREQQRHQQQQMKDIELLAKQQQMQHATANGGPAPPTPGPSAPPPSTPGGHPPSVPTPSVQRSTPDSRLQQQQQHQQQQQQQHQQQQQQHQQQQQQQQYAMDQLLHRMTGGMSQNGFGQLGLAPDPALFGLGQLNDQSRALLERMAMDPMYRMQMELAAAAAGSAAPTAQQHHSHAHTHSHTHLHLHPTVSTANAAPPAGSQDALLLQQMSAMSAAAGGRPGMPPFGHPFDPAMLAALSAAGQAVVGFPPGTPQDVLHMDRMRRDDMERRMMMEQQQRMAGLAAAGGFMLPPNSSDMMRFRRLQQEGFGALRPP